MFVAARALFELQLQRNSVTPLLVIRVANYYHLSPHIRAHVLCAGVRARDVFLKDVAGARAFPPALFPDSSQSIPQLLQPRV